MSTLAELVAAAREHHDTSEEALQRFNRALTGGGGKVTGGMVEDAYAARFEQQRCLDELLSAVNRIARHLDSRDASAEGAREVPAAHPLPEPDQQLFAGPEHTLLERRVVDTTVEVMRSFRELERTEGASHPSHLSDVARAVHDVQRVLAMRLARRADPRAWGAPDAR